MKAANTKATVTEDTYDAAAAVFSQDADVSASMLKVLKQLKTDIGKAKSVTDMYDAMKTAMQSTEFGKLSQDDKDVLHNGFLYAKAGVEYAKKNGFMASNGQPLLLMVFDFNLGGKSIVSINSTNGLRRKLCYLTMWAAPGVTPQAAYATCDSL